ncbi:hypothetical protein VPH35_030598 [Triticum aestivum]
MPPTTSARKMLMFLDALCSTSGTVTAATRVRSTPPTEVVSRHGEVQRVAPLAVDCMAPTTCITSPLPADHPCCVAALLCSDAPPSGWRTRIQGLPMFSLVLNPSAIRWCPSFLFVSPNLKNSLKCELP